MRLGDGRQRGVVRVDLRRQHDVDRAVAQGQPRRVPLDDPDVRLVRLGHAPPRLGQQRRVRLDAVGAAGAPREQHRVVADPGADVGDALAADAARSARAPGGPCAPGRWPRRGARGARGRPRSRPAGSAASGHLDAQLSAGRRRRAEGGRSLPGPGGRRRPASTRRRSTRSGIASVAPGRSGPQPSEVVPAGSPCSPGPTTHFVQSWTSGGPPSRMRSSEGSNGARKSTASSSVAHRRTSSSMRSAVGLVDGDQELPGGPVDGRARR